MLINYVGGGGGGGGDAAADDDDDTDDDENDDGVNADSNVRTFWLCPVWYGIHRRSE